MLNLTNELMFIKTGYDLESAINLALEDTCKILHDKLYPGQNIRLYDVNKITGSSRNPDHKLSFLLYFHKHNLEFNQEWVQEIFNTIKTIPEIKWRDEGNSILQKLKVTDVHRAAEIGFQTLRGLHIFLIALWARKAILLPMSFPLPKSRVTFGHNTKGSRKIDSAYDLYPPLLKIVRLPFQNGKKDDSIPNIKNCIPHSSTSNYNSIGWRPIIASTWQETSDINIAELNMLFTHILENRRTGAIEDYRISAMAWTRPLLECIDCHLAFTIDEVRSLSLDSPPIPSIDPRLYLLEKKSWTDWIDAYIDMLYQTGRVKKTHTTRKAINKLVDYIFIELSKHGIQPVTIEDVTRFHIDGADVAVRLREFATQREVANMINFLDYVSAMLGAEGISFTNPLTSYDKRSEPKPSKTNKKTLAFNSFRLFYAICYTIFEFIKYLNDKLTNGDDYLATHKILSLASHKNPIIDTESLGYLPVVSYLDIQGQRHLLPLHYIPYTLLCLAQLPIKNKNSKVYWRMATPDNIGAVIIALETSIRFIHIRWLDKYLLAHEFPELRDDFQAIIAKLGDDAFFELFVNTDKSGSPWVRATSVRLLRVISAINSYKKNVARGHYNKKLHYTHHDLSSYPLIAPLFHDNDRDTVLTESRYREHYKQLIYFFNIIKIRDGQAPTDPLPFSGLDLTLRESFEEAYQLYNLFKTDYTPHGIRATVISLSSTFLSAEHIGEHISGHNTPSVNRYCVINKELVQDVNILAESIVVGSLSWQQAGAMVAPATAEELIQTSFAIQPPDGRSLTNEDIIQRFHMLSVFSTHFCLARGVCPSDILATVGKFKCGQCYLALKGKGHVPAILALIRNLASEIDALKYKLKHVDMKKLSDGDTISLERQYIELVNEFSAWSLTVEHILKNESSLEGKFMTVAESDFDYSVVQLPENNKLLELLIRANDAVRYPSLSNAHIRQDIFKMSAHLMKMDESFVSILSHENTDDLIAEFRGRLETLMIATNYNLEAISSRVQKNNIKLIPAINLD